MVQHKKKKQTNKTPQIPKPTLSLQVPEEQLNHLTWFPHADSNSQQPEPAIYLLDIQSQQVFRDITHLPLWLLCT